MTCERRKNRHNHLLFTPYDTIPIEILDKTTKKKEEIKSNIPKQRANERTNERASVWHKKDDTSHQNITNLDQVESSSQAFYSIRLKTVQTQLN